MKHIIRLFTVVLSVLSSMTHANQGAYFNDNRLTEIENFITQGMQEEGIPGVSVALIEAGNVVYLKGFGVGDSASSPITPQTPFQLASVTKSFSALLILQLEKQGKLKLSDRVIDHLPWFTTLNKAQSDLITIRNLLQHNSGLSKASGNYSQNSQYREADATERSVKKLSSTKLSSKPGSRFEYSNSNYHIVSHLVELIEDKPFEQAMAERIFQPLNMNNSYVQIAQHETHKAAVGFPHWFGHPVERQFILGRMKMGDGGVVASAEDMTKYLLEVAHGNSGLVTKSMRDNLLSSVQNNIRGYALGWNVSSVADSPLYEHDGTNGGFSTLIGFSDANELRKDLGFVILTNYSSALHNQFVRNLKRVIFKNEPRPSKFTSNLASLLSLYITILALAFTLYRTLKNTTKKRINAVGFIVPVLLLSYSYGMAYVVPSFFGTNLLSIYPFFPDQAVGLIGCAFLASVLAAVKIYKLVGSKKIHTQR